MFHFITDFFSAKPKAKAEIEALKRETEHVREQARRKINNGQTTAELATRMLRQMSGEDAS